MRNLIVKSNDFLRHAFPWVQRTRRWTWKYFDRTGVRFIISGGRIPFMDAMLQFPEGVGLLYSTPLFWNGPEAYEAATSRALALLIQRSRVFLDIGSNMGIYSVYAGLMRPDVVTFAFEPVPTIWKKNVAFHQANGLPEKNVLNLALGDREGTLDFYLPAYDGIMEEEQTGTLCPDSWQTRVPTVEKFGVSCTTLDNFAAAHSLPEGSCCLKIDVENHEAAVLRGGEKFIEARRPWIVCEVLPKQKIDEVSGVRSNDNSATLALIGKYRYVPFALHADGLFRMTAADFERARDFKDFILAPEERLPAETSYLALSSLAELLPNP